MVVTLVSVVTVAQDQHKYVNGVVLSIDGDQKTPIPGAFVRWIDKKAGVFTNDQGKFSIMHMGESPSLVVSYVSFKSDTIAIDDISKQYTVILQDETEIGPAIVLGRRISYGLSRLSPRTTVLLGEREFQKAACCNLSESFENAPAIDVSFSDAVTGTKQIKMLGLDGFYTLIGREYMPAVRTLNSYYGLSLIPAAWVEGIQITKGAGSVVNGHESMAGQINIEMKKPFGNTNFLLDQFVSQGGRAETDFVYRKDLNKHLATSILARYSFQQIENDRNNDGFLDMPKGNQFQIMNRWQFATDNGFEGIATVSYNQDEKLAGQKEFYHENDSSYGVELNTKQFDAIAKIGKTFKNKPLTSLGSQFSFNKTLFDGNYGSRFNPNEYRGESSTFYMNLLYQSIIKNSFHQFQTGISLTSDQIEESYQDFRFSRTETVPGAFFEYTYKPKETFSLVGGIRTDYNLLYGWSVTPRIHSKYRFNKEKTVIRVSTGMGRRTSNPLAQSQQIFTSSRNINFSISDINLPYGLEQEVSLNSGLSFEHDFHLTYMPATIGLDYFNTTFFNEVVVDREVPGEASFYNMKNGTRANSFQTQLDLKPARRTEVRLAYRMFDVQTKYNNLGYLAKPFISKHRSFINVTQRTRSGWQFSSTGTWYGPQRIAGSYEQAGDNKIVQNESPSFVLVNAQVSKTIKKQFEIYTGVENMLDYRQDDPIQDAVDPFGSNFDAGLVWGPVFGRMIYGGFRWRIHGE